MQSNLTQDQKYQYLLDYVKAQAKWKESYLKHYKRIGKDAIECLKEIGELEQENNV